MRFIGAFIGEIIKSKSSGIYPVMMKHLIGKATKDAVLIAYIRWQLFANIEVKGDEYVPLHYCFELPMWTRSVQDNGCG